MRRRRLLATRLGRVLLAGGLWLPALALAEPLFLECAVKGISFDSRFQEVVAVRIDNGTIDVASEEFPLFGRVEESATTFKASKKFTSQRGVKYFFSIEIDRVSGRFMAYETAAHPNRKIYNTTGSGPCTRTTAQRFQNLSSERPKTAQPVKVIIRSSGS